KNVERALCNLRNVLDFVVCGQHHGQFARDHLISCHRVPGTVDMAGPLLLRYTCGSIAILRDANYFGISFNAV
ncbi:MAG TPA: hypothetical protein VHV31_06030, partial [Nitrolancea sp.]|nr:hypothetical protein [Nitrolancea sp.]